MDASLVPNNDVDAASAALLVSSFAHRINDDTPRLPWDAITSNYRKMAGLSQTRTSRFNGLFGGISRADGVVSRLVLEMIISWNRANLTSQPVGEFENVYLLLRADEILRRPDAVQVVLSELRRVREQQGL